MAYVVLGDAKRFYDRLQLFLVYRSLLRNPRLHSLSRFIILNKESRKFLNASHGFLRLLLSVLCQKCIKTINIQFISKAFSCRLFIEIMSSVFRCVLSKITLGAES